MKNRVIKHIGVFVLVAMILQSCGIADLRTKKIKEEGVTIQNTEKGKQLLEKAWKAQGFDKLKNHSVYSFHGNDTWKGLLGGIGKIWSDKKTDIAFKYRIGTFDGQVHFFQMVWHASTLSFQTSKPPTREASMFGEVGGREVSL